MNFKWLRAKRFLSIGDEEIKIDFEKFNGNVVLVKGMNLDVSPESSNGSGKSTLMEIIVYALYGKIIKGLPHGELIHKKFKKGMEVEVCFELNGQECRILRGLEPDKFDWFVDGVNQKQGVRATQKAVEAKIKLNYEAFINVVCFGEHNNHAFLSCEASKRRLIVENLLGLEKYVLYQKKAKDKLKDLETELSIYKKDYSFLLEQRSSLISHIEQMEEKQKNWISTKKREIQELKTSINLKENELSKADDKDAVKTYQQAQERIKINKDEIVKYEENRSKMASLLDEVKSKLDQLQESRSVFNIKVKEIDSWKAAKKSEISSLEQQLNKLSSLKPGIKCSLCHGTVDQKNYDHIILHNNELIEKIKKSLVEAEANNKTLIDKINDINVKIKSISEAKNTAEIKLGQITSKIRSVLDSIQKDSQIKEPSTGSKTLLLAEQLKELQRRLRSKVDELDNQDPYAEILDESKKEADQILMKTGDIRSKIDKEEAKIPYYKFWIEGFGDNGIRALVIEDILPAVNARINYGLQFLIENKIDLSFDNKFNATIQRNPSDSDPFVYDATSGGEKRRINLAISQAFGYATMLSAGIYPNIVYLDEVALNVDVPGTHGIYSMIMDMAKDRKVFVTTHDPNLNDLLASCDAITVVKENGFSTLKN